MATWPTANSFPQKPASNGMRGGPRNNVLAFQPEVGEDITRRRGSAVSYEYDVTFPPITETQLGTWQTFFETTLKDGADNFTWDDPIYGDTSTWRVKQADPPYQIAHAGHDGTDDLYTLTMTLSRIPD